MWLEQITYYGNWLVKIIASLTPPAFVLVWLDWRRRERQRARKFWPDLRFDTVSMSAGGGLRMSLQIRNATERVGKELNGDMSGYTNAVQWPRRTAPHQQPVDVDFYDGGDPIFRQEQRDLVLVVRCKDMVEQEHSWRLPLKQFPGPAGQFHVGLDRDKEITPIRPRPSSWWLWKNRRRLEEADL